MSEISDEVIREGLNKKGYKNLMNAIIVVNAAEEYEKCVRNLVTAPRDSDGYMELLGKRKRLAKWFYTPWYHALTSIDGDYLLKKIEEKVYRDTGKRVVE